MKGIVSLIVSYLFVSTFFAQENKNINNGIGVGYHIAQYQVDFGIGLNFNSPHFFNKRVGVRLKSNLMFHQGIENEVYTWIAYGNVSLGIVGISGYVNDRIRLYGEGGVIGLILSERMSSADFLTGGYGLFGFEFLYSHFGNYFIEIGGVGHTR